MLVDTSVWRRFFQGQAAFRALTDLLEEEQAVLVHPFVLGELVMGGLSPKEEALFNQLPSLAPVPHHDVVGLVRRTRLIRRGIGWADAHLLASVLTSSALLWSADKELAAAARELAVGFGPAVR